MIVSVCSCETTQVQTLLVLYLCGEILLNEWIDQYRETALVIVTDY
ncbi:hypothetical protein [Anaerosporobacter faecicola]|nr:hypothetical protein [Anaerosporobacter faecicola]